MKINPDDPRLTAYALDEMDSNECRQFEQEIANDPETQQSIHEIRELAGVLAAELKKEPVPSLTKEQKRHIHGSAGQATVEKRSGWWGGAFLFPRLAWGMCALLFCAGILMLAQPNYLKVRSRPNLAESVQPMGSVSGISSANQPLNETKLTESIQVAKAVELPASSPIMPEPPAVVPPAAPPSLQKMSSRTGSLNSKLPEIGLVLNEHSHSERTGIDFFDYVSPDSSSLAISPVRWESKGEGEARFERPEEVQQPGGQEVYAGIIDNPFRRPQDEPLSTFSIDVDTASYSNVRRFLDQGDLPPGDAVRIEELLNYFPYDYTPPAGDEPFAVHIEWADCPWASGHRLARIALKGREIPEAQRPTANLVFLIDVSGSMDQENKLPLVKSGLQLLLGQLKETDRVAIVTYAGNSGLALPSTACSDKATIRAAIEKLESGGSTHGAAGIQLAYKTALDNFIKGGINRVILATDGDFNVGVTSSEELESLITEKAKSGVFLSVLGFGMGNYKDATLETLADKGNGNYAYIDNLREARKVLVEQIAGTLITIAKDVKIQVEFNPGVVGAYRLIGYENRIMAAQDFNDDRKDAGEIGAGHTLTALYEVVPVGVAVNVAGVDPLKYQANPTPRPLETVQSRESFNLKLRYKLPAEDNSHLLEIPAIDSNGGWESTSVDFRFAASVAAFGMVLRNSPFRGGATFDMALNLAQQGKGQDKEGYRSEFIQLIGLAKDLKSN
ncbi:MAG: hypothetical protein AMXMBFR75_02640 [Candidatus Hinthialibacteria bacterium]